MPSKKTKKTPVKKSKKISPTDKLKITISELEILLNIRTNDNFEEIRY